MATYVELYDLASNAQYASLRNRTTVACIIAAENVMGESPATPNHANRLLWAKAVFESPEPEARRMLQAVLAANNTATVAQILGATDTVLQNNVNAHIDLFATG